ncbi:glycosyltransferase family 4 protein [Algoriphagus yeomjeoni]|uniref:Glycosyltransferase involved in cell wall biosynthesis n=1 Tax=Algoriphagus yeomjeoni TaxID=291403 RepID=A0A327PJH2_9BACT|nr:glycosyltransferase family 4 protein [Algoriphagus yeomjeoni]RAI91657.1 glycosyltransferase involved in cell wall biosynthesis [Algoriphagus yeomjeoni]
MKIAVILPSLKDKAPIQVAKNIIKYFINKKCIVDVFYFDEYVDLVFPCNTYRISIYEKIDFNSYDIIHSHMLRPNFYIWLHRKRINTYCISTLHNDIKKVLKDYYNNFIAYFFTFFWIQFLKSHDYVVCLSNYAKRELENNYNFKRLGVIHNGRTVDINCSSSVDLSIKNNKEKGLICLGVLANLSRIKGVHQIIDVLPDLSQFFLIIIGDGPERTNLELLATQRNVSDRCLFFGHQPEAHRFLSFVDIYMMTSYSEGFPLALLESAQYKKPTVCSNIPIFNEFFSNEEVVFFDLDDKLDLTLAIKSAYERKDSLSDNIFFKYCNNYTNDIMGDKYFNLFKSIL